MTPFQWCLLTSMHLRRTIHRHLPCRKWRNLWLNVPLESLTSDFNNGMASSPAHKVKRPRSAMSRLNSAKNLICSNHVGVPAGAQTRMEDTKNKVCDAAAVQMLAKEEEVPNQCNPERRRNSWFRKNLIGRTPSLPSSLGKKKQTFFKVRKSNRYHFDFLDGVCVEPCLSHSSKGSGKVFN